MKQLLSIVSILLLCAGITSAQIVTSINPIINADDVSGTSDIIINFSEGMNNATITTSTVIISGNMRGLYTGSFTYGATSATFDPDSSFFAGEIITVVVTEGVKDSGNDPLTAPYRRMFTVETTGDGEFTVGDEYTADGSNFTDWTITADINEDGYIDIITLVPSQNKMSVFTNDGDGTFSGPTNYTTANSFQVEAKDVDQDGSLDLVTSNNNAFMMSVFINNGSGSGTFASKVDYANGSSWPGKALTTGDIDNDGDEDVLVDIIIGGAIDSIQVFLNDGDGTFTVTDGISTTDGFEQLKLWDIDGDEDLDLIGISPGLEQLLSWKNDGSGNFSANTSSSVAASALSFTLANFNGIGPIDAITTGQEDDQYTIITEDASFLFPFWGTPTDVGAGDGPTGIASGDLDGDGDIDAIISNANDQNLSILINNGSASFTESNVPTTGTYANYVSLADVDNDGDLDIVIGNQDGTIQVMRNYGGPNVSSITPAFGALDISASTDIEIKFDEGMDSGTMDATTVKVIGSLTGLHGGSYTYTAGDSTLTINPNDDFLTGEVVSVVVTTGVESTIGTAMEFGSSTNFVVTTGDGEIFGAATNFTAGNETKSVITADVNDDGDIDMVVVNTTADSIAVLIGGGDGTFDSPVNYYAGDAPGDVAVGDLDGDGDLDLIVSTTTDNVLSRFLNNGDGTFAARSTFASTSSPGSISLADIDNDGDLDVYYSANNVMYTQSNNGSGTFSSESVWGTNSSVVTAPVDLNGDGLNDYVGVNGISLNFVLNDGDGTFTYGSSSLSGFSGVAGGVVTGDFDGDGDIDIVSSYKVNSADGYIAFSANNGSGSMAGAVSYTLSGNSNDNPGGLEALDIDGDGDLDIAVVNTDFDEVVVFINDGNGVFTNDGSYSTGDSPEQVSSADFNGDGIMDLVVANSVDDNVSVLLGGIALEISSVSPDLNDIDVSADSDIDITFNQNVQSGTVTTSTITAIGSVSGSIVGAVSYDGGSFTATLNPTTDFIAGETVTVFVTTGVSTSIGATISSASQYSFTVESTGGEIFLSPTDYEFTNDISDLKFVDFDNDGDADIVSAENGSNGGLAVYLNDGSGGYTFSDTTASSDTEVSNIAIADFDQDGYLDAAGTVENMSGFFIQVFINDQAGSFNAPVEYSYSTDYAAGIDAADINKDGYPDIVATRYNGNAVHMLQNDGDGTFTSQTAVTVGGGPYLRAQLIDVDSDSDLDLVTSDWDDNTISVAKNNGDGTFASHTAFNMTGSSVYAGTFESGDIDGDGDLDLVASQTDDEDDPVSGITVFFNDGSGDYSTTATISATANDIALLDMEGDGDLDLVLANEGIITVFLNDGSGSFTASPYESSAGDTWIYAIHASDIDGDGDIDLAAGTYDALHVFMNGDLVNVSSTSPSAFGLNVTASSNITITFNTNMDVSTFQDTSVILTSSVSGVLGRGLSLSNPTLTIDPTNDFLPGEIVTVLLTNDLESSSGTALYNPYSFSFTVEASGNGNMEYSDTLNVNSLVNVSDFINADIDNDGDEDLFTRTNNGFATFINTAGVFAFDAELAFGWNPGNMQSADFDSDGDIDFISKNYSNNNAVLISNDGTGSFSLADTLSLSSAPYEYIVGDFDNDGYPDIASLNGSGIVYVYYGVGDFTFTSSFIDAGVYPNIISAADIDSDGDLDLLAIDRNAETLTILENVGGSFSTGNSYDVGTDIFDMNTADLNGDGYVDIAVASEEGAFFSVLLNDGDGTFASAVEYSTGAYWMKRVIPFDYDGDGDLDLAMFAYDDNESTEQALFAYNNGDGGFGNQGLFTYPDYDPYWFGGFNYDFVLSDYDGDGDLDIISQLTRNGVDYIGFAENVAAGASSAPTTAASNVTTSSVTSNSAKISWTNGDGARRLVLVKEGSAVNATPVDDTGYNPNPTFESGTELGTGNFAVYGGVSNSVIVTGLDPETEYHIQVFEMNGIPGSEKFFNTGAPTGDFTTAGPPTVWSSNDSTLIFTKADEADWTLEANQDRITENAWLTRAGSGWLFNYADEASKNDNSPSGTQWALGTTDDLSSLSFQTFYSLWEENFENIAGTDMVVYIESDDLYFDINFSSWTSGSSNGGGFSYTRAKGPEPTPITETFEDSAGFAVKFDGGNSFEEYIEIYIEDYIIGTSFTTELWVKPDVINQDQVFLALDYDELVIGLNSSNQFYAIHNEPEAGGEEEGEGEGEGECPPWICEEGGEGEFLISQLSAVAQDMGISSAVIEGSGTSITAVAGEWYHIALTGQSGGLMTLYVNGVEQDTASIENVTIDDSYWVVGSDEDRSKNFNGTVDELRIWKSVRTESQIRSNMHRPYSGQIGRLIGYWQFNEGTGSYTYDGLNNLEGEFYDGVEAAWVTSDVPLGQGTVEETADFQSGTANIGNVSLNMADGFDNPVDIQVTQVSSEPNTFPSGYTAGLGGKYFVINLFGDPGTFTASLTLDFGSGVVTSTQESNPSLLKLYKRSSTSTGEWTIIASASSADEATGVVTWNGITSFSQFMAVADTLTPFSIELADGSDIISYSDSTYTFSSSYYQLSAAYADSALTINSTSTLSGELYLDQNSNGIYDSGTDNLLIANAEFSYTPTGSIKLRYRSSTPGVESTTIKLQTSQDSDSVSLDFFTVEGSPTIAGNADENGWYLLSNPFSTTLGELLDNIWTQGAVNSDAPGGTPTLYTFSQDSSQYVAITTDLDTTKLDAGVGILVYIYAFDDYNEGIPEGGGWPKTLTNYGNPFGTNIDIDLKNVDHDGLDGTSGSEGFALLGNPFAWPLSADSVIATIKREDPLANSYVYRWNPVAKTYQIQATGPIEAYESFFVRIVTSETTASLDFDYSDADASINEKRVAKDMFEFKLTHNESGLESNSYLRFDENASKDIDPFDGYYLGSYATEYANLYTQVGDQKLTINNLPNALTEETEFPIYLDATLSGNYEVTWNKDLFPKDWKFTLEEVATGTKIDLTTESSYSFRIDTQARKASQKQSVNTTDNADTNETESDQRKDSALSLENKQENTKVNQKTEQSMKAKDSGSNPVFILTIKAANTTGIEDGLGIPTEVELDQNYPNPFNPTSVIRFGVPNTAKVQLEVFDILGRKVMTLVNNETKQAGRYNVQFEARNLASGMYIYRLVIGDKVLTKKMTLIK